MMKNAMTLGACLVSWTASAAPELDVSGECPGDVTIEVTELDPYATVTVVYGEEALPGDDLDIPRGPCTGVETDLATGKRGFDLTDSDGDGRIRFTTWVSADRCGTAFHVLDVDSCEISNLNFVPDAEDDDTDYYDTDYYDTDYYEHYYDVYGYSYGGTSTTDPLTRYEYYDSVYGEPTSTGGPYTPTSYYDAYYEELVYHYYDTLYVDGYDTSTSVIYVSEIYDMYEYYADTLEAYYTDGTLYAYYYGSGSTTYHDSYDETDYEDCRYEYYYDYCEYIGTVTSSYTTTYEDYYGPTTYYSYIDDYYYYVYEVYYGSSATSTWLTWDYSSAYTATLYAYYFSTLYDDTTTYVDPYYSYWYGPGGVDCYTTPYYGGTICI